MTYKERLEMFDDLVNRCQFFFVPRACEDGYLPILKQVLRESHSLDELSRLDVRVNRCKLVLE